MCPHELQPARILCPWGFSRQEYWSGLPCLPPGDLPNPVIKPRSPTLKADSLPFKPPGKPSFIHMYMKMKVKMLVAQSCLILCDPMDCSPPGSSVHVDFPGKNTGVGCHAFLQGIFPIQGSDPGFPHSRQILYCLSHHGSPRILEWVAYPFSRGTSQPRNQTGVSCIAGRFFSS